MMAGVLGTFDGFLEGLQGLARLGGGLAAVNVREVGWRGPSYALLVAPHSELGNLPATQRFR